MVSITFGRARRILPRHRRRHLKIAPFSVIVIVKNNNNNNNNNNNKTGRPFSIINKAGTNTNLERPDAKVRVHAPVQRTRDQPSARVEQERAGATGHAEVTEETIQVRLRLDGILFIRMEKISVCGYNGKDYERALTTTLLSALFQSRDAQNTLGGYSA